MASTHVAIMGDLVGSESAPSAARLHAVFNNAVSAVNADYARCIVSPLTITLGDEFQGLCRSFGHGLQIVRTLRDSLLSEDVGCRFVLGVVGLETPLNAEKAWNMMGPGLAETRDKLADKRDPNAYRFHLPGEALVEDLLEAIGLSITEVEAAWTARQKQIVWASLAGKSGGARLIGELGLSAGAFYKIRRAARFDFYRRQWGAVESAMGELDRRYGLR